MKIIQHKRLLINKAISFFFKIEKLIKGPTLVPANTLFQLNTIKTVHPAFFSIKTQFHRRDSYSELQRQIINE